MSTLEAILLGVFKQALLDRLDPHDAQFVIEMATRGEWRDVDEFLINQYGM